jgi:hypothetical protein
MRNYITFKFNENANESTYYYNDFKRVHYFPNSIDTPDYKNYYDLIIIDTDYSRINIAGYNLYDTHDEILQEDCDYIEEHVYEDDEKEIDTWIDYIIIYDKEIRFNEPLHMPYIEMNEIINSPEIGTPQFVERNEKDLEIKEGIIKPPQTNSRFESMLD